MNIFKLVAAGAIALLLGACADTGMGNKETAGTLIGAGAGALVGSQFGKGSGKLVAVGVGTLAGAFIGNQIGKSLDRADRLAMEQAQTEALDAPMNQTIAWNNPDSGHHGTVTPVRDGTHTQTGSYCREFQHTVIIGGKQEEAYGTACRQPDGSWKVVQ